MTANSNSPQISAGVQDFAPSRQGDLTTVEAQAAAEGGRQVIVLLGSGRSGTSLCAKILRKLGVRMDATLHRPNEMNPEGYFEDRRIVEINRVLLDKLCPAQHLPPRGDVPHALVAPEMKELRTHLADRAFAAPEPWGFKDPRVSVLLPHYRRAFQAVGIVPVYVFCARDAGATVQSLVDVGGASRDLAEQIYYTRSFLALRDSGANCHVLHYERLLADPLAQIEKLWRHISGGEVPLPLEAEGARTLVDPKLNRSSLRTEPVRNPMAARIAALIADMEGTDFDRHRVTEELREIAAVHAGYQLWIDQAAGALDKVRAATSKAAAEKTSRLASEEVERLQKEMAEQQADAERREATIRDGAVMMTQELSNLQAETNRLRSERDAAVTQTESRTGELSDLERKIARLERALAKSKTAADEASRLESQEVERLQKVIAQRQATAERREDAARKEAEKTTQEVSRLQKKLSKLQAETNRLRSERDEKSVRLQKERERFKIMRDDTTAQLQTIRKQRDRARSEIAQITGSVRHRAGTVLVEALQRPGWQTLALPWRLMQLRSASRK